jgi:hypothetical protein
MMGLTDRVEPWARRFQRRAGAGPLSETETEPTRASLRAVGDDDPRAERHTGRFTRRALQEQER